LGWGINARKTHQSEKLRSKAAGFRCVSPRKKIKERSVPFLVGVRVQHSASPPHRKEKPIAGNGCRGTKHTSIARKGEAKNGVKKLTHGGKRANRTKHRQTQKGQPSKKGAPTPNALSMCDKRPLKKEKGRLSSMEKREC